MKVSQPDRNLFFSIRLNYFKKPSTLMADGADFKANIVQDAPRHPSGQAEKGGSVWMLPEQARASWCAQGQVCVWTHMSLLAVNAYKLFMKRQQSSESELGQRLPSSFYFTGNSTLTALSNSLQVLCKNIGTCSWKTFSFQMQMKSLTTFGPTLGFTTILRFSFGSLFAK